jgi:glycosyltransferase involved in cell wall biosynthesis
MKLSIILPVYNVEKYITKCIDSLLNQDLKITDYEIIVVSDGSKDKSEEIVKSYCDIYNNIHLYIQKNCGVGSARNNGLKRAKGNYVYFLDPDDFLAPNVLAKLVSTSIENKLDVMTFDYTYFKDAKSEYNLYHHSNQNNELISLSKIVEGEDYIANIKLHSYVWLFFIKREFINNLDLKFIEGRWMEDAVFSLKLFLEAKYVAHYNLDAHRYRITPGTAMTSKEPSHYLKIIRDLINAVIVFDPIVKDLESKKTNPDSIKRIKARQQSFVFFSMIRMIQSTISFDEVKLIIEEMSGIKSYPLDSFLCKDFNKISYHILVRLFNRKSRFYFLFLLFNPFFKFRYKLSNPI